MVIVITRIMLLMILDAMITMAWLLVITIIDYNDWRE